MGPAAQRAALQALIDRDGARLGALSALLGRNAAYLQQYLKRGSPRLLTETDRETLARYFGVADAVLGGPERPNLVEVPRLRLAASAGAGRETWAERPAPGLLDPALLRRLGVAPREASVIRVEGDSMQPTLIDGDEILIDAGRAMPDDRARLFVLRLDDLVIVKRVAWDGEALTILSDNPAYPPRRESVGAVRVIGQVVWLGRALA